MLPISDRTAGLGTENAFVVLEEVLARVARGIDIRNFCIGQPDFATPDHIRMAAVRALDEGRTGYTPSAGIPELREAVARRVGVTRGIECEARDVVVGCGAKPFIGYVIQSVTDAGCGHEVIHPTPGFPIYASQARAQGAVPVALPLRERDGYKPDPEQLARLIGPRTRLLILNSPHNPTGAVLEPDDLAAIARVLERHPDVWVLSDEPYSALVYDGRFASIASLPSMTDRTVVVDAVSKTYAMPGWRIGWAVNRRLAPHLARWVTNTDSCAPHPCQWGAFEALRSPQTASIGMREVFRERRDRVVAGMNAILGVTCTATPGAFYAWTNVTDLCLAAGVADSEALRRRLLDEARVAVLADHHFGARVEGEGEHLRWSFAASTSDLEEGLRRFGDFAGRVMRTPAPAATLGGPRSAGTRGEP